MSYISRKDPVGEELRALKRKRLIAGTKSVITRTQKRDWPEAGFFLNMKEGPVYGFRAM